MLVGINLLREGLDLPEVSLVAILDADKEGFLRSAGSLIQTSGRAARNVNGRVIMYADTVTDSMRAAIGETDRRRALQAGLQRGARHHAAVDRQADRRRDVERVRARLRDAGRRAATAPSASATQAELDAHIAALQEQMRAAAANLDFEKAAASATTSNACATPSWACRGRRGGPDRRVLSLVERWLKKAALEVQEYVRLTAATLRGVVTPPFYRHDIVEQFDADRRRLADRRAADRASSPAPCWRCRAA